MTDHKLDPAALEAAYRTVESDIKRQGATHDKPPADWKDGNLEIRGELNSAAITESAINAYLTALGDPDMVALVGRARELAASLGQRQAEFVEHHLATPADGEALDAAQALHDNANAMERIMERLGRAERFLGMLAKRGAVLNVLEDDEIETLAAYDAQGE